MKLSLFFVVIAVIVALVTESECHVTTREVKNFVGQQPLLFGRRGLNPNMNSLFFGKRGSVDPPVSLRELKNACSMLMTYLDDVDNLVAEEV